MGNIFPLAGVTKRATMLAAQVGVGAEARPEPVIGPLALIEDGFGLVADELRAPCHITLYKSQSTSR
jgi:hypothetical protein